RGADFSLSSSWEERAGERRPFSRFPWFCSAFVTITTSHVEGSGLLANSGFRSRATKKNARRALKEIGLSACGYCSKSNPSPGTMISTPVFGCELFVAQSHRRPIVPGTQLKIIHQVIQ